MIQIDETTRNLLLNNSVNREIILRFPDDDFEITGFLLEKFLAAFLTESS